MKVGILTFHGADNYGAILQAYALQETLSKLGHNAEIINYQDIRIINSYKIFNKGFALRGFIRDLALFFMKTTEKHKKCENFRKRYLRLTKPYSSLNLINESDYDVLIVGSDQVWNITGIDYNSDYFFSNIKGKKKISYAASMGTTNIGEKEKEFIKENIKDFDYISVREKGAQRLLEELITRLVYVTIDPTLLVDRNVWNTFLRHNQSDYIFVYRMTYNPLIDELSAFISQKNALKVISISNYAKPNFVKNVKNLYGIGPIEFLNLIYNAKYVITDSFHGTSFSLVFQKEFYTVNHQIFGGRTQDLLERLNLEDRIISQKSDIYLENKMIDYKNVEKKLERMRGESFHYLEMAL